MKRIKAGLAILAALLAAGGVAIFVAGRASDGPLGFFSGGPVAIESATWTVLKATYR